MPRPTHPDEVDEVALQEAPLFSLSGFVKIDQYAGQARIRHPGSGKSLALTRHGVLSPFCNSFFVP
jgi:hypothetical protein